MKKNKAKGFKSGPGVYLAPVGGYYQVSAKIHKLVPTGRFSFQPNPGRWWWQFWKPKEILRPEYRTETAEEGCSIKFYREGEIISPNATRIEN